MPFISLAAVPASIPVAESFFTRWMPAANGSYVKVYLHLLYLSVRGGGSFSSRQAADRLYMSESEVLEALRYWEEKGLLRVQKNDENVSLSLCLPADEPTSSVPEAAPLPVSAASSVISVRGLQGDAPSVSVPADTEPAVSKPVPAPDAPVVVETRPSYSPSELAVYSRDPQVAGLFRHAAELKASPLSLSWQSSLYSLYDYYRLPIEVLDYLLDYCAANKKLSANYLEAVARNWADQEIDTVEKADAYVKRMDVYVPYLRAMGITNRYPSAKDAEIFFQWDDKYHFPGELYLEACRKSKGKGDPFTYADKILDRWYRSGVHTLAAVRAEDKAHREEAENKQKSASAAATDSGRKKNFFNDYTHGPQVDYDALERRLTENPVLITNK